jgi:hypothetical protein
MTMTTGGISANFEKVVFDWGILEPDMVYDNISSALACAVLCGRLKVDNISSSDEKRAFCLSDKRKEGLMYGKVGGICESRFPDVSK